MPEHRPPWRVHSTPYDPAPIGTTAFIDLYGELRPAETPPAPDPLSAALRRIREMAATLGVLKLEVTRWLPGDPPPGFPTYYRTPLPELPPAPERRALMPAPAEPIHWRWV